MTPSEAGTRSAWALLLPLVGVLAVVLLSMIAVAIAADTSRPFGVIVVTTAAALAVALILHSRGAAIRWGAAGVTAIVVVAFATWWSSSSPPEPEDLIEATLLVHESPLRGPKQPHAARDVTPTGEFCSQPCQRRSEQSDFLAPVDQAAADISARLRGAGFKATVERASGQFLTPFNPGPGEPAVIRATKGRVDLTVSLAASDIGTIVASVAE